jgi:hypothetical protein
MVDFVHENVRLLTAKSRLKPRLTVAIMAALVASILGGAIGVIFGSRRLAAAQNNIPTAEIIVPNGSGLLFKSEDGVPLLKIGRDAFGTHVRLLSSTGESLVELSTAQGTGGITVGSKNGGYAYVQAQKESANITLIGKYNKEAVQISSATMDGSGILSINEGKQGYRAVEIGAGSNRLNSKGTITIRNDNGVSWQAP